MFTDETKLEFITSKMEWKINDIYKLSIHKKTDHYLTSKYFYNAKCPSVLWRLRYYPAGVSGYSSTSKFVSLIQVRLDDSNDYLTAEYEINALVDEKLVNIVKSTQDFKNKVETYCYSNNLANSLRTDGSLLLVCTVEFLLSNLKTKYSENSESSLDLKDFYGNMLKQETFSDCVIQIGNESINAHRCILAQNSIVFRRMFEQNGMIEAQNGIVEIDDCSSKCFRAMLEFCYTGIVSKSTLEDLAEDLFAVAHKYELIPLKEKCEHFMASIISMDNIYHFCHIIEIFGSPILENAISKLISANRNIFASDEWKKLKGECVALTQRLMESIICNA